MEGGRAKAWSGPLVTAAVGLAVYLLAHTVLASNLPVRGALYGVTLSAVAYASYAGGLRPGLVAAAVASGFAVGHYLALDAVFPLLADRAVLAASVVVITFAIAATTGVLSDKAARSLAAEHALAEELRRKNAELEATNRALLHTNETLDAFTYVVSHDLKEPVRAIATFTSVLDEDHRADLPPPAADLVKRTAQASARLGGLVEGLLEFSRAARLPQDGDAAPRTVGEVLRAVDCEARIEQAIREREARVEVEEGPPFRAPLPAACQIMGNLVLNAVRHNPAARPRVRVSAARVDDAVEIVVEDDGPGFPAHVAEAFARRAAPPASLRGGFGLLIARRVAEALGGELWVGRSASLGGAAVHVRLPAAADAPGGAGRSTASPQSI